MTGEKWQGEHYRTYAVELRALADSMKNPESKKLLLKVADDYDRLAGMVEERMKIEESVKQRDQRRG